MGEKPNTIFFVHLRGFLLMFWIYKKLPFDPWDMRKN